MSIIAFDRGDDVRFAVTGENEVEAINERRRCDRVKQRVLTVRMSIIYTYEYIYIYICIRGILETHAWDGRSASGPRDHVQVI